MGWSFDGAIEHINFGDVLDLDAFTDFTFMAWFKVDAYDTSFQTLLAKGDSSWRFGRNSGNSNIGAANGAFPDQIEAICTTDVSTGALFLALATWDDSANQIEIFINGTSETTNSTGSGAAGNTTHAVEIAENSESTGREWEGPIYDCAFWSRILTQTEITSLSHGVSPRNVAEDALEWMPNMFANDVTTLADYSGNALTGTTTSSPTRTNHISIIPLENFI